MKEADLEMKRRIDKSNLGSIRVPLALLREQLRQLFHMELCQTGVGNSFLPGAPGKPVVWSAKGAAENRTACSVGWWLMAGAGLFSEKSTAG
jgi:hypothetical protein